MRNEAEDPTDLRVRRIVGLLMGPDRVTTTALARAIGMPRSSLAMRLTGQVRFSVAELGRVATFFGVDAGIFFADPGDLLGKWASGQPSGAPVCVTAVDLDLTEAPYGLVPSLSHASGY